MTQIYIDGCLKNRLHSFSYESAVIFGVNINRRHVITLQATTDELLELHEKYMKEKQFSCEGKLYNNNCFQIQ